MSLTVQFIQDSVFRGDYELSLHADEERLIEGLTLSQLEDILQRCELLEDYPDDPRGPSCLVLGYLGKRPIHCVCGLTRHNRLILITVYEPQMPKWRDDRTRNRPEPNS